MQLSVKTEFNDWIKISQSKQNEQYKAILHL